jgi:hypothetical protein
MLDEIIFEPQNNNHYMKKLIVALSFALFLFSCDNGNMETINEEPNPFVGTWEAASGYHDVFELSTVTVYDTNNNIYWKASYTYDDISITVTLDTLVSHTVMKESWGEVKELPYYFTEDALYLYMVRLEKCNCSFNLSP